MIRPGPSLAQRFGIRGPGQLGRDLAEVARGMMDRSRFQLDPSSLGLVRPGLSLPAYAGYLPADGLAPVFNLYDRTGGGRHYSQRVTRKRMRDFRGGCLSYDEHDGTDLVCPVGMPLCAAAPGVVVMVRDRWLRGGLTVALDHGGGVVTQYSHCSSVLATLGRVVRRGQPVALSGCSGIDMTSFFPWVPPHVHFMVWVDGHPTDPFLAAGEAQRTGTWLHSNDPHPSGELASDPAEADPSDVDEAQLERLVQECTDGAVIEELRQAARLPPAMRAALLEDALRHDAHAWPEELHREGVRRSGGEEVLLTLPLPLEEYRGVYFADPGYTAAKSGR